MTTLTESSRNGRRLTSSKLALLEERLERARVSVTEASSVRSNGIRPRARDTENRVLLSYAQERLWFLDQLNPGRPVYNVYQAVRITGPLDRLILERSLEEIGRRHEVLRTNFTAEGGRPVQVIAPERRLAPAVVDLSTHDPDSREAALRKLLETEIRRPFELAHDALIRVLLVRNGPTSHALLFTMHHIISDGWSIGVLFQELADLYEAFAAGQPSPLPPLSIQYADFALWERSADAILSRQQPIEYWRNQLGDGLPELELPTDHPRTPESPANGAFRSMIISRASTHAVKKACRCEGVTLFMMLMAAFQALLHRYTGQDTIPVGTCVPGRSQRELEKLLGFFVNTLVFRGDLSGNPAFRELLNRTRETTLGAFANQDLSFERLVQELRPDRNPGRNPFFQVMFVLQHAESAVPQPKDLTMQRIDLDNATAKFDLTLSVTETAEGLDATIEYSTDLFEADTIARMLEHYRVLLEAAVTDPGRAIGELPVMDAPEYRRTTVSWNETARDFPRSRTVHNLFEEQAARAPDSIALSLGDRNMSYGELNRRSNQLAHHLRGLGVLPGTPVALCLERSVEMVVALLGILKAGGAYVALEPSHPSERLAFMLADTEAAVIVTTEGLQNTLPAAPEGGPDPAVLRLDADGPAIECENTGNPEGGATAEDPAYISYTSGSTGRPKGVCIPHRAVNRLLINTDYIQLGPADAVAQISTCAFDASTFEIWGALLYGARVAIFPPEVVLASPRDFASALSAQEVTTMFVTTALFNQLADATPDIFHSMRLVLFGGEAVHPGFVRTVLKAGPPASLIHVYGPTEATTFATSFEVRDVPPEATTIPIGRPIANTTVYVLDRRGRPAPIGVPGELYIGGEGLANGYLHRPDLDAERFVPNPFNREPEHTEAGEHRLYRTGDRVRWRADGTLEYLGRLDRQVKVRGHRVEPEEIEAVLEQHEAVGQSAVVPFDGPAGIGLVAFVVPRRRPAPTPAELRRHLRNMLPDYMVPPQFSFIAALPIDANGKVNRRALAKPEPCAPALESNGAFRRTETERRLADLWKQVLGVPHVGSRDNFFELGGHSLAGVRLFVLIEQEFGCKLPLASLFQAPTVEQMAQRFLEASPPGSHSSVVALQPHGSQPPLFFVHGAGGGNLWTYANLVPHLDPDRPVYALESRGMRGLEEFKRIEEMAAHYLDEIRAVQKEGPYYLGGYCFGGIVAYEIARNLEAAGESVAMLALLDSAPSNGNYGRIPWWNPRFLFRFGVNTGYWLQDFLRQDKAERRRFVRRKTAVWKRQLARRLKIETGMNGDGDLDEFIDVSRFPEIEVQLWKTHLDALRNYRPGPYGGRVTLFRTRAQPFLCSFDPKFGWDTLTTGGVDVVKLPGAHERIFEDPYVRVLSDALRSRITQAQSGAVTSTNNTPQS